MIRDIQRDSKISDMPHFFSTYGGFSGLTCPWSELSDRVRVLHMRLVSSRRSSPILWLHESVSWVVVLPESIVSRIISLSIMMDIRYQYLALGSTDAIQQGTKYFSRRSSHHEVQSYRTSLSVQGQKYIISRWEMSSSPRYRVASSYQKLHSRAGHSSPLSSHSSMDAMYSQCQVTSIEPRVKGRICSSQQARRSVYDAHEIYWRSISTPWVSDLGWPRSWRSHRHSRMRQRKKSTKLSSEAIRQSIRSSHIQNSRWPISSRPSLCSRSLGMWHSHRWGNMR